MKKILIFSTVYYPRYIGGAEVAVKEITDRISPSDIEFHMVTLRAHKDLLKYEKVGNVHVHRIGLWNRKKTVSNFSSTLHQINKTLFPFFGFFKALRLHKKYRFDATWSIMAAYAGFAALFFKWRKPDVPFILTLQEGDPISHIRRRVGIFYPIFKQIFKKADVVQAISSYLADFGKSMGHKKDIFVIPNGVDISLFTRSYGEQELGVLRWNLHKETNDIFLVTTSRLVIKNGLADVIKSLPLLSDRVKFLILGVGELESELKKLAHELGVEKRVIFQGFVDYKDIPRYLKISDIFIRPSLSEGMGNSFIEAMASSIPVIATPVGGIPDFLVDKETGLFCKVNDSESIAMCVNKLIDDELLRNNIIKNALKMVVLRYDWKDIASAMNSQIFKTF